MTDEKILNYVREFRLTILPPSSDVGDTWIVSCGAPSQKLEGASADLSKAVTLCVRKIWKIYGIDPEPKKFDRVAYQREYMRKRRAK